MLFKSGLLINGWENIKKKLTFSMQQNGEIFGISYKGFTSSYGAGLNKVHKIHWTIWHILRGFEFLSQTNLESMF